MKILLFTPYHRIDGLIDTMCEELRKHGLNVDTKSYTDYTLLDDGKIVNRLFVQVIAFLMKLPISKWRKALTELVLTPLIVRKVVPDYDIINLHFYHRSVKRPISRFFGKKKVIINIWGSDFYRANKRNRKRLGQMFAACDRIIIATDGMRSDVISYYQDFENKITLANFGNQIFETMKELKSNAFEYRYKTSARKDKLITVCGYNGKKEQQHPAIIQALTTLDKALKRKLYLILPMTYGVDQSYKAEIIQLLSKSGIEYELLEQELSTNELAQLRLEADFVINTQTTDAFAGSLQEHLFGGALLLVGDWLPYSILEKHGIFYMKSSLSNLHNAIKDCISNFEHYQAKLIHNPERMYQLSSWEAAGKRFAEVFREVER